MHLVALLSLLSKRTEKQTRKPKFLQYKHIFKHSNLPFSECLLLFHLFVSFSFQSKSHTLLKSCRAGAHHLHLKSSGTTSTCFESECEQEKNYPVCVLCLYNQHSLLPPKRVAALLECLPTWARRDHNLCWCGATLHPCKVAQNLGLRPM